MSTTQKVAELKKLSKQTQENIFDMLRLANDILADHDWVDSIGDEAQAMDKLESDYFSHFGGSPSLGAMLQAYRKNSARAKWVEYRYNIRAMIDLANPPEAGEPAERVNWKQLAKATEEKLVAATANLEAYARRESEMRAKIDEQNGLIGEMRGRIAVLEQYAPRRDLAGVR